MPKPKILRPFLDLTTDNPIYKGIELFIIRPGFFDKLIYGKKSDLGFGGTKKLTPKNTQTEPQKYFIYFQRNK